MRKQLSVILLVCWTAIAYGQSSATFTPDTVRKVPAKVKKIKSDTIPIYQGIFVGLDLLNPIIGAFSNEPLTVQVSVEVDLKHAYYPVVEAGFMSQRTDATEGVYRYQSEGGFGKIGINYNPLKNKMNQIGILYLGIRYGFALFNYNINDIQLHDNYWPGALTGSIHIPFASAHWGEILGGIRVHLGANVHMGFNVGYRFLFGYTNSENSKPGYIPGYGSISQNFGYTYSLYYHIP